MAGIPYHIACEIIVAAFGKNRLVDDLVADDFDRFRSELATGPRGKRSPASLTKDSRLSWIILKYVGDVGLIERPVRFGPNCKQPSKRIVRKARQANEKRLFSADEMRTMLNSARQPLKAMILLAINGGLGRTDLANLPKAAIDFEVGWTTRGRKRLSSVTFLCGRKPLGRCGKLSHLGRRRKTRLMMICASSHGRASDGFETAPAQDAHGSIRSVCSSRNCSTLSA